MLKCAQYGVLFREPSAIHADRRARHLLKILDTTEAAARMSAQLAHAPAGEIAAQKPAAQRDVGRNALGA